MSDTDAEAFGPAPPGAAFLVILFAVIVLAIEKVREVVRGVR